jgi:hypothetical protein
VLPIQHLPKWQQTKYEERLSSFTSFIPWAIFAIPRRKRKKRRKGINNSSKSEFVVYFSKERRIKRRKKKKTLSLQ